MGKHSSTLTAPPRRPWQIHPIWRGLGCLMTLIGPIIAYAGAYLLVEANNKAVWVPLPAELLQPVNIRFLNLTVDHLWATLIVAFILLLLGFALISFVYGLIYRLVGPPRYGPLDADPYKDVYRPRRR